MHRNGKTPASTNGTLLGEPLPPPTAAATPRDAKPPAPAAPAAPVDAATHKLRTSPTGTIAGQLLAAQVAIDHVLSNPALLAALAPYSYDAERMRAGRALYERAQALHQQQQAGYGERYAATDARDAARTQAHDVYKSHLSIARVALRGDRGAAQVLGLTQPRKRSHAVWLNQAQQFYANALGDSTIEQRLAAFGATTEQLRDAQQLVDAVAAKLVDQQKARQDALALTKQRDTALAALNAWMRDFRAIARVALGE